MLCATGNASLGSDFTRMADTRNRAFCAIASSRGFLRAAPDSLLDDDGTGLDPEKAWRVMMTNEKPGGHGDRAVAVATVDMALWDATAKLQRKPLYQVLADRYSDGQVHPRVPVYAAGGYYYPGKDISALKAEMRSYLDSRRNSVKTRTISCFAPLGRCIKRLTWSAGPR